jgi:hypothetical protein
MKVIILQKCFTGAGGNRFPGEEVDLPEKVAEKLILTGFAEKKKAAPKAKKSNRMMKNVFSKEDEY